MMSQTTYYTRSQPAGAAPRPRAASSPLVLVVEDHASMRETLVALLTMESIDTITAANGEEALLLIYQHKPKLVLLDMQLPGGISGLDVLKAIRCNPAYAGIRVILHTSEPHAPSLPEAQAADLVVLKPADPDDLLTFIYRLF